MWGHQTTLFEVRLSSEMFYLALSIYVSECPWFFAYTSVTSLVFTSCTFAVFEIHLGVLLFTVVLLRSIPEYA